MRNIRLGTMGIASVYFVKWNFFRVHYSSFPSSPALE
jgi:hypothetical protein